MHWVQKPPKWKTFSKSLTAFPQAVDVNQYWVKTFAGQASVILLHGLRHCNFQGDEPPYLA